LVGCDRLCNKRARRIPTRRQEDPQGDTATEILDAAVTTERVSEEVRGPEGAPEGIIADSSGEQEAVTTAANEVIPTEQSFFAGLAYTQIVLQKLKVVDLRAMCRSTYVQKSLPVLKPQLIQ
jgi:hypothetical protein